MDSIHKWTDLQIYKLERRISMEYRYAASSMQQKLDRFMKEYDRALIVKQSELKSGDITPKDFKAWLRDQAVDRKYLTDMVGSLSDDVAHVADKAASIVEDALPSVYAENANWAAFEVDSAARVDTMFTLQDEDTVREIMGHGTRLFEPPRPNSAKVLAWTDQKITSAVTQGILMGESIPHIADRIMSVYGSNRAAAVRAARTACTGAENAGRVASYERAEQLGIDLRQEWMATIDDRTRDSHIVLDGERVQVGESFHAEGGDLRFPGDPQGPPEEVYNCRCTLVAAVDGIDQSAADRFERLPDGTTYEEWKQAARERLDERREREQDQAYPTLMESESAPTPIEYDGDYTVFSSMSDAKEFFASDSEELKSDKVSSEALHGWTSYSTRIQEYSRHTMGTEEVMSTMERFNGVPEQIGHMDDFIASRQLDEGITVYRTLGEDTFNRAITDGIYHDDGFTATTTDFNLIQGGNPEKPVSVWMEIDIPPGSGRGAYLEAISEYSESEYLLPRGQSLEIIGSRVDDEGRTIYRMRALYE